MARRPVRKQAKLARLPPLTRSPPQLVGYPTSSATQRTVCRLDLRRHRRQLPAADIGFTAAASRSASMPIGAADDGDVSHEAGVTIAQRVAEEKVGGLVHQALRRPFILRKRGASDQRTELGRRLAGVSGSVRIPARKLAIRSTSRCPRRRNSSGDISSGAIRSWPTRSSGFRGLLGVSRRRAAAVRSPAPRHRRGTRSESRSGPDRAAHRSVAAGGSGPRTTSAIRAAGSHWPGTSSG
jgi:hypothetical protein